MAAFARAASAGGILLLLVAGVFAASPALAQTLSVGINSNGTGDATGIEGDNLTFTVKMSATRSSNTTVKWRFVAGTAGSGDYTRDGTGNLTISAGSTTATFSVDIVDDTIHENAESFEVEIYDATGASISRSKAQVTIGIDPNNPDTPQFRIDPAAVTVDEGVGTVTVTVRHVSFASEVGDITIDYTLVGITATAGDDFDATGGTLTFRRGRLDAQTARVRIVDDGFVEEAETFEVRFGSPSIGAFSGGGKATVTIRAHEEPVSGLVLAGERDDLRSGRDDHGQPRHARGGAGDRAAVYLAGCRRRRGAGRTMPAPSASRPPRWNSPTRCRRVTSTLTA